MMTIGKTKDTAEFVCDNIEYHWNHSIKQGCPSAKRMLILCDSGRSNSCLHYVVNEQMQKLSERLEIDIVMAHYPAYFSKWNPIEHKAFCHITKTWRGVVFNSYEIVRELAEKPLQNPGFLSMYLRMKKYIKQGKRHQKNLWKICRWNLIILFRNGIIRLSAKHNPLLVNFKAFLQVLTINLLFFIVELTAGFIANSMGLVADSLDMLADSIIYGLALWALGRAMST